MNSTVKTILFWVFILICLMLLWGVVSKGTGVGKEPEYSYSELVDKVQAGQVQDVTIQGTELHGHLKSSPKEQFHVTIGPNSDSLVKDLTANKVNTTFKNEQSNLLLPILFNVGPFILIGAIWFFMLRQMQSGGNKALSFGKSRARLLSMQQKKVTFKDVAGVDEAKEELSHAFCKALYAGHIVCMQRPEAERRRICALMCIAPAPRPVLSLVLQ